MLMELTVTGFVPVLVMVIDCCEEFPNGTFPKLTVLGATIRATAGVLSAE
jgi:hypothetical protein